MGDEVRVAHRRRRGSGERRAEGRALAERLGFPRPDPTLIATAISEVARNIVVHVGRGEIVLRPLQEADRYGLVVVARDEGAGIRDVEAALRDDYSGSGGLGLGLPGARRLMDEFEIESDADSGHYRDDEEMETARRAGAPARGAPPACVSGWTGSRSSGAWPPGAGAARRRAATSRSSPGCPTAPSSRRSTAWGTASEAARAAEAAGEGRAGDTQADDLVRLVGRCHNALTDTRGAAISLAFVSCSNSTMTWLGVGNVEGRVMSGDPCATRPRARSPWPRRSRARAAESESATLDIGPGDVLCWPPTGSGGLRRFAGLSGSPQAISERIIANHWRPTDDALVVAVRFLGPRP